MLHKTHCCRHVKIYVACINMFKYTILKRSRWNYVEKTPWRRGGRAAAWPGAGGTPVPPIPGAAQPRTHHTHALSPTLTRSCTLSFFYPPFHDRGWFVPTQLQGQHRLSRPPKELVKTALSTDPSSRAAAPSPSGAARPLRLPHLAFFFFPANKEVGRRTPIPHPSPLASPARCFAPRVTRRWSQMLFAVFLRDFCVETADGWWETRSSSLLRPLEVFSGPAAWEGALPHCSTHKNLPSIPLHPSRGARAAPPPPHPPQ